jgi:hypothetical protein
MLEMRKRVPAWHPQATLQLFSALKHTGVDEAQALLTRWLEMP